jgi:hypothetical protein
MMDLFLRAALYAYVAWLAVMFGTYIAVRFYFHRKGEPPGWRFNHHGASAFSGLSFYERGGGRAVVVRMFILFPLFWTVQTTPEPGACLQLETAERGPVWSAVPWAYRYMANMGILNALIHPEG